MNLEPDERSDRAAGRILPALLEVIEANLPGAVADIDSEFLHDLRVSVRRTRSLQRQLRAAFPAEPLQHFRAEFRWLQRVTGPSRDLDVYVLEFDDFSATLPERRRPISGRCASSSPSGGCASAVAWCGRCARSGQAGCSRNGARS